MQGAADVVRLAGAGITVPRTIALLEGASVGSKRDESAAIVAASGRVRRRWPLARKLPSGPSPCGCSVHRGLFPGSLNGSKMWTEALGVARSTARSKATMPLEPNE
mgnify:CR=1 FL=1